MPKWDEITVTDEYKSLPPQAQAEVKTEWFKANLLPEVEKLDSLREMGADKVYGWFMQQPDDTGEGALTSAASSFARGALRPLSDIPIAVGALTGSEGIEKFGRGIQEGVESRFPVNPIQEGFFTTEIPGVAGQVASMLAGGGAGAVGVKALGGTAKAAQLGAKTAVGTQAFAGGTAGGAASADVLGLKGGERIARSLLGGVTELASEAIPFGMGAETGLVRNLLGESVESGAGKILTSGATEAAEEGFAETAGQATDIAFRPEQASMDLSQIGKAMLLGGAGGVLMGGINNIGRQTPLESQTPVQQSLAAEINAIPTDVVPDQTDDEKLVNMNAGGTTVVDPQGKTAVIAPPAPEPPSQIIPKELVVKANETSPDVSSSTAAFVELNENLLKTQAEGAADKAAQMLAQEQAAQAQAAAELQAPAGLPVPTVAPTVETPSPAMEQIETPSQTITDFNGEIAPEMPVPPPTAEAGAGVGEAIQAPKPTSGRKPALAPQVQEMLAKAAAINAGTQTVAPSTNEFVQKMTGQVAPPITPQGISPKRVRIAGEEYSVIGVNPDGTLKLSNDQGDEFDTNPNEQWSEVTESPKDRLDFTADEIRSMSKAEFIRKEIERAVFKKKLAIQEAEVAIRNKFKPKKPLPVGVSKVTALQTKARLTPEEKQLLADYNSAQRMRGASDVAEMSRVKGEVWEKLQKKPTSPITPTKETPTPATEGTVMPGGSAMERDVDPLIQDNDGFEMLKDIAKMRRESGRSDAAMESRIARIEAAKRGENVDSGQTFSNVVVGHPQFEPPHPELRNLIPIFTTSKDEAQAKFDAVYNLLMDVKERIGASTRASMGAKTPAQKRATEKKFPSNETARLRDVVTYLQDETLPELDRLINATPVKAAPSAAQAVKATVPAPSPQTTTVATPTETAAPLADIAPVQASEENAGKIDNSKVHPSLISSDGTRKQLYHGKAEEFADNELKINPNNMTTLSGIGPAWFTTNRKQANRFSVPRGNIMAPDMISLKRPLVIEGDEDSISRGKMLRGLLDFDKSNQIKNKSRFQWSEQEAQEWSAFYPRMKAFLDSEGVTKFKNGDSLAKFDRLEKMGASPNHIPIVEEFRRRLNSAYKDLNHPDADPLNKVQRLEKEARVTLRAAGDPRADKMPPGEAIRLALQLEGYDGVVLLNTMADTALDEVGEGYQPSDWVIPFTPEQVVSKAPQSPQTEASEAETAAPLAKEAAVASVVQQPAEGSIPAVEQESATTAIESNEKTDIADAAMAFLEEDLTESKRQWSPEKIAAAKAYFASGGKDTDVLRAAFPKLVGSRPIVQAYLKADKDASEAQAKRDAADAKLAKEIERDEKEQAKAEEAQRKREELNIKTLNSLIEKTRTNVVQGTVKSSDANQAVAILNKSGAIPNVLFTWIGTSKDFLADPANRARYPETWKAVSSNPNIEGMSENGQPIVFTDNVGVSDLDRNLAKLQGTTPEVAAVRRVILHENIHKGMFFLSLKDKMKLFQFLHRLYSPEELDQLAKSYDEYSDWRINQVSYFSIIEEAMTRDFDSMAEIPRDGIWAEFMQFLRDIWQKITGKTSEPTLKNYKDVFRLIRNSLKNSEAANADRLANGGGVRMSMSEFISNVTPAQDAAYAKAVADGDMETAQRMVDEAAKAAGYDAKMYHGSDEYRDAFAGGAFFTDSRSDASGYARLRKIYKAAEDNDDLMEIVGDVMSEEGMEDITDMSPDTLIDIADANGFDLRDDAGFVFRGYLKTGNTLDISEIGASGTVREAWDFLHQKGLVDEAWSDLDEDARDDLLEQYKGKAYYRMFEGEGAFGKAFARGYDTVKFEDQSVSGKSEHSSWITKSAGQFKSADPVTRDDAGNVIPLSRRFQTASNDIRFSKVEYDSPNEAAFNSGAEVARNADYDERDKAVRSTIRAAYDLAPKDNGPSVPLDELFSIVQQSMPDLTETEFSRILQGLYEDSGALLIEGESPFATFTTEGERAGSAIIMPPTDMTKDDVISMLRGMSAANPAPSGGINQELYDTVLTQLRNFISNGGRVPLPIQSYGATKAGRYNYTRQKDGLERDLRQGSGIGGTGQIDTGASFRDKVERENLEIQRIDSEVSRNRETTTEGRENRKREAGARPNVGMAGSGYSFADYAQIASRIGARVQEVSNDIGGGLAAMADGNGATTILINATQLGKRVAGTSFGLDEDGAIETIGNALVEELIHAADLAVQREAWIASGRRKPFTEFAIDSDKSMLDEMREVVASSNDPVKATQILHDAIQASRQLYESGAAPSDIDKFFASEPRAISSVMSEFVRQMIQQDMHQTVSEASLFRRFIERVMKMLQKIRDAIAPAKAGEFGDILKNRINETEMMLAMAYQQTGARASMIDPEDAATKQFAKNIKDINSGTAKAPFGGVQFTNFMPIDRAVKSAEEYSDAAIKYVNSLENEGVSLDDIANSVISPAFLESIGIEQDLMAQDALTIEVRQRVDNAARKAKSPDRKKQLSKLSERLSAFWQGVGSKKGQHLGQRRYLVNKARYSWMFIRDLAERAMKEARTNILISNFGSENATSFTQNSYADSDKANQQAVDENINAAEEAQEFDQDAADLAAGEATLTGAFLKLYEDLKDLLRQNGLIAKARASRVANAAKASISDTERNAIMSMSDAELNALESKNNKRIGEILNTLLGKEEAADTTEKKTVRKKREKMVEVAKKRADQGKPIEPTEYVPIITENPQRDEIIDDVSNALLQAAKKRGVKPSQKTALADLVASIKSLLKANIKGEDLKADEAPLGQLLARTYLDNLTATEAKLFTESWNDGRKKVRAMLTEMGVEGTQLEAELNAIMPATPTIAYNPSAVRKAITRALREAGLDANDILANTQSVKSEILKVWDKAAVDAGLTPSVWQEGRKLAEKSIDEFVIERKASKEKAKQIAKVVSEQANNPVSLADFSNSLSQFKLNDSKVKELFDKAKVLANKKVQIANDRAIRVLFEAENNLAQSAFFNSTTKPDTIVKAFREQVSDPMSRQDFKARMDAMKVSGELADRLFDKAAREKDNAQWKRAQDMLEGPNALRNILREINRARPGEQAPLSKQIPWRQLLSQSAKTVDEYRQRIFDAISANEELKNATPEQKARLADLFAEAWESNRTRILDGMLERMIRAEEAKKNLSKEGAKALQAQRMRIVEDINLGIFDNDELAKRMAEKFGIKSEFTETEREKINSLIEVLQDEGLNAVKRQVAAYKLLEVLQGELKIPVVKMLADFWVSSVLSGPNTIVSIGLAVASGAFELSTALSRVFIAGFTNQKQLPSELAGAYKTLARLLSAYGRQANIAWQYLVSGDPVFLDPSMNDVTENMQWGNIGKSNKLAEQMAKSDKVLIKSAGLFMRTVSRLLTALDVFNSGLTKEGSLSIVFRQIGLDPAKIAEMEKKSDLKPYKDTIIQQDFKNTPPKSARDKAILDAYALADMMKELDKLGNVSENANFFGQQGAMTLDPSGLGGVGYRAIRSLVTNAEAGADRFLKQAQRGWNDSAQNGDRILSGLELAFAYFMQFAAYNAANFGGVRFARFAGNKFNQGLSFIPGIGFARAFEAEFDPNRISGKEAFIDSIRRNQLIGVMLSVAGYQILKAIADEPDDEKRGWFINGGWGNLTPEKKQQKLAAGEKEYTIGINGKVFNYANWPISSALAAIGSLSDLIRFSPDQWNDKNVAQIMASAAMSGAAAAADIPALSQFQELFGNSLSSKDPNEKRMERFAKVMSSYAGGFVPRFLKDIDYAQDPNLRKYETLWEKTASHIPVYRRYEGKEYYDILGQQIQRNVYPGSREFMVKPTDPAYKVLGALNSRGIWLTPANAEHRMVGKGARRRSLTQEEADNYSLETGKGYKQMLLRYGQRALQMPTERARAFLLDKADEVRDRALKKVYRGYQPAT